MTDDIKLPPLPPLHIVPSVGPVDYPEVAQALMDYARAAILADREGRQQWEPPRAITHAAGCWSGGPEHYACAAAEIERLREQLRLATVDQAIAEAEASDAHAENKRLQESLAALEQEAGRG